MLLEFLNRDIKSPVDVSFGLLLILSSFVQFDKKANVLATLLIDEKILERLSLLCLDYFGQKVEKEVLHLFDLILEVTKQIVIV